MAHPALRKTPEGLEIRLYVQPNASKSDFVGLHGDRIKVRVHAKPAEGAANAEVIALVARTAGVAKSTVEIQRGATVRQKDILVRCADPVRVESLLIQAVGPTE